MSQDENLDATRADIPVDAGARAEGPADSSGSIPVAPRYIGEVGGYRLVERLGAGGMGTVYSAEDGEGARVALKRIHPHVAEDPASRERLQREVALLHRVRTSGVARVLDAEVDAEDAFIVTELIEGPTLEDDVRANGAFAPDELSGLAHGLADALHAIHAAGIVHRDLKPSNVMLSPHGPVLIDFGIAQVVDDARLTQTGLVTGTPGYVDPDMIAGSEPGPEHDWWSWAAVLMFAASGHPPFGSGTMATVLGRVTTGRVSSEGAPPLVGEALAAALHPDLDARLSPQDVLQVIDGHWSESDLAHATSLLPVQPRGGAAGRDTGRCDDGGYGDEYDGRYGDEYDGRYDGGRYDDGGRYGGGQDDDGATRAFDQGRTSVFAEEPEEMPPSYQPGGGRTAAGAAGLGAAGAGASGAGVGGSGAPVAAAYEDPPTRTMGAVDDAGLPSYQPERGQVQRYGTGSYESSEGSQGRGEGQRFEGDATGRDGSPGQYAGAGQYGSGADARYGQNAGRYGQGGSRYGDDRARGGELAQQPAGGQYGQRTVQPGGQYPPGTYPPQGVGPGQSWLPPYLIPPKRRPFLVILLAALLSPLAAVLPGSFMVGAALVMLVVGAIGVNDRAKRRWWQRRPPSGADKARAVARLPWDLVISALHLLLGVVVAAIAALLTYYVVEGLFAATLYSREWIAGTTALVAVAAAWLTPTSYPQRGGARVVLGSRTGRLIALLVAGAAGVLAFLAILLGTSPVAWTPFPQPPPLADLVNSIFGV